MNKIDIFLDEHGNKEFTWLNKWDKNFEKENYEIRFNF